MRRRAFIVGVGATALVPITVRAQQDRVRRIVVLSGIAEDDPEMIARRTVFEPALGALGWTKGSNLTIDYRSTLTDPAVVEKAVADAIALAPDLVLSSSNVVIGPLMRATRTIPIVVVGVIDPVGQGIVQSMARPGGNVTGFTQFEYSLAGKWLEVLKEAAPRVSRVAVMRDPTRGPGIGQFAVIQAMASTHGIEPVPINILDLAETERALSAFASTPNGGMIATVGGTAIRRDIIIAAAAKNRLPAIYPYRYYAADGGLISYGPDTIEMYRAAAGYIDRVLKGEKPADMPIQAPTRYQLIVNLKTAKALGLSVPPTILARADEVIE